MSDIIIEATVIEADSFGQLVRVDADPTGQEANRAMTVLLAGYSGQTTLLSSVESGRGVAPPD